MRIPCLLAAIAAAAVLQNQTFRTGVDLVAVEVTVVDKAGQPIPDMKSEDFEVFVSNHRRPVVSIERLSYGASSQPSAGATATHPDATSSSAATPRRMYVIAVDEQSLQPATTLAAINAAERFIDKLQPEDLVGVYAYPTGTAKSDLTSDHAAARKVLRNLMGLRMEPVNRFNLSMSEVIDVANGDAETSRRIVQRECANGKCSLNDLKGEAIGLANFMEMAVAQSVGGLRGLLRGLAGVPGRKVLVLVSGGLISTDRVTGRVNNSARIAELGREAAAVNLDLYVLHLDWSFQEALGSKSGLRTSYFRDSNLAATGLEMVAGAAGGAVMRVYGTSPDVAFDRVLRETSAYYLLGVEPADEDRDGRSHLIRVKVKRRGAELRSRAEVTIPKR